ncbi:hypothetical protein [Candidatus Tisiphia endosymbiont of Dascillus cervinus]|uniref:hypothetical protein n=1 Tax=Candidatus Tisiphia endosymbiont of Dascillus cervinus TaxID=3066253 RepID=UPI00312CA280
MSLLKSTFHLSYLIGNWGYLASDQTALRTALNLYNYSLKNLDAIEEVREACGMTKAVQGGYHAIASDIQEALLCGQESAPPVLAYLCYHGYGMKKDIEKVKLFILIGENLGNPTCVNFMCGQNDDSLDIKGFLQSKPVYSSKLQQKALLYATAINNGIKA